MSLDALDILGLTGRDGLSTPARARASEAILLAIETTILPREITFILEEDTATIHVEDRRLAQLKVGDLSYDASDPGALCRALEHIADQRVTHRSLRASAAQSTDGLSAETIRAHLGNEVDAPHDVAAERLLVLTTETALAYSTEMDDWGVTRDGLPIDAAEQIRKKVAIERIPEDTLLIVQCETGFSIAIVTFYGDSVVVLLREDAAWQLAQSWATR